MNVLGVERDGTRRLVVLGLRALAHPSGAIEVASEFLPTAKAVQVLSLPERLGGGFLFWAVASRKTQLWRAESFTGTLEPFAELDFEAERLVSGFDRLYVRSRTSSEWFALDAESGAGLGRGNLPTSPSHGEMAFADEWLAAVEVPARGVLVSFDAGGTWHPLGRPFAIEGELEGGVILSLGRQRYRLSASGSLLPEPSTPTPPRELTPSLPNRFAGLGSPLAAALLRGYAAPASAGPRTAREAWVALRGALARVDLGDGRVIETLERPELRDSECTALTLGTGFGFVCQGARGETRVLAARKDMALELVQSFPTARSVISSGNGGLVWRGECAPSANSTAAAGVYCVRAPSGSSFEVVLRGDRETARVLALSDGRAGVLVTPQPGRKGSLSRVDAHGKARTLPLKLLGDDPKARELFESGFWLETWVERVDGQLSGWVTNRGSFAGVRVLPDGGVKIGPSRRGIERALLSGERALWVPGTGGAEETRDGGMSYHDVDLPLELTAESAKAATLSGLEQGCSLLGCVYAGWAHVGAGGSEDPPHLGVASSPKSTRFPQPGGGRWILRCSLTGDASRVVPAAAQSTSEESGAPTWGPFLESPPPARAQDVVGFNVSGEGGAMRAYAWAAKGADFKKAGRFAVSVLDRYRTTQGVWSTAFAPSPWSDVAQVSELFGYDGATPSAWRVLLDPGGRAGVLSVSVRGNTDLFAVEENLAPTYLGSGSRQGITSLSSAVKLGTIYYVATYEDPRTLRIFQVSEGRTKLVGRYTDLPEGRGVSMSLVRSAAGDALGLWARSGAGWYVFPIDLATGRAGAPTEVDSASLSKLPRSCAVDEEGYLLDGPVGVEPYVDFVGAADRMSAHGYVGRFILGQRDICLSELSAIADGAVDRRLTPEAKSAPEQQMRVPMTVVDRTEHGRRWGFRCGS
ncbi:MAG TPA: hypothetical protein VFQ61_29330 [Polyangiaceae bacterium]|nr:hypothetical protein [Polyangiaceae bacterium]